MNVLIDSTGVMYFGDERATTRNCPHCHALSRMSPTAIPTFDELLLQKPRSIGVVLRCNACNAPVFLRYAVRAYANNRVELSPQGVGGERNGDKHKVNSFHRRRSTSNAPSKNSRSTMSRSAPSCFSARR